MAVFRAPGRVNLIGEHTDYNQGFVLPMALELSVHVSSEPSPDDTLRISSEQRQESRAWNIDDIPRLHAARHWSDYPIGVAQQLIIAGFPIEAATLTIRSTVPEGAGLSSSAALEVACALAFLDGREMPPLDLALLCQRAEREFVGMPCGIMDQYVAVFGVEHAAVEIDCRSLTRRIVPLPRDAAFVAVNTMVKHALASSAYADRVAECAEEAAALGVESLRDAKEASSPRARHVISENRRVRQFVEASARCDLREMGLLMIESHRSLQYDYEVSCPELNFLVEAALTIDGVCGSRMTGGGFGGCTVTMLRDGAQENFRHEIVRAYEDRFHITPEVYDCVPGQGAMWRHSSPRDQRG